jgi:hypothetical protein
MRHPSEDEKLRKEWLRWDSLGGLNKVLAPRNIRGNALLWF